MSKQTKRIQCVVLATVVATGCGGVADGGPATDERGQDDDDDFDGSNEDPVGDRLDYPDGIGSIAVGTEPYCCPGTGGYPGAGTNYPGTGGDGTIFYPGTGGLTGSGGSPELGGQGGAAPGWNEE